MYRNKVTILALSIAAAFTQTAVAQTMMSNEERIEQLERRLAIAEQRANISADDNTKSGQVMSGGSAGPVMSTLKDVNLKFSGDVEFNADAFSKDGGTTGSKAYKNVNKSAENWGLNGRVLLQVDADKALSNGIYSAVRVQPLMNMDGSVGLDDAYIRVGEKNNWEAKLGRYEAYDMFPLNNDTFIEYSGNTANDVYADGHGYIYQMKEARGRSNSGGGLLLSKQMGDWYVETNILAEDGSALFTDGSYHNRDIDNRKNSIYLRPVIAYKSGNISAAVGAETNVINNAYGYTNSDGRFVDQSKRNGYGATFTYDGQKDNPDGVVVNVSTAYMDAASENDFSAGINGLWHDFELGYIFAHNDVRQSNKDGTWKSGYSSSDTLAPGRYNIHTVHASYRIPNVLDFDNMNLYLGAYASTINSSATKQEVDDRYGLRARVKYFF